MDNNHNQPQSPRRRRQKVARSRGGGPSVVMRVPENMQEMVLSFVDIMADYHNREPYGQVQVLPPSRTSDEQRRKLCKLMGALADYELERQRTARRQEEDRRQLTLFGGADPKPSGFPETYLQHLLHLNESFFAYSAALVEQGFVYWNRISPNVCVGDTVFLFLRDARKREFLFRCRVVAQEQIPESFAVYRLRPCPLGDMGYRLQFEAGDSSGRATRESLAAHGMSHHSLHKILDDEQADWLDSLMDCTDCRLVFE